MRILTGLLFFGLIAASASSCREGGGEIKVLSLAFDGTSAVDETALRRVLVTQETGWLPWSEEHSFDRADFEADLKRIVAFYADRGFPDARVSDVRVEFNDANDGVRLDVAVEEGEPVIVEEVNYEGFDVVVEDGEDSFDSLSLEEGGLRDRDLVRHTRIQASGLFRDRGYPLAVIDASERPGANEKSVIVTYRAQPGPRMTFGEVKVSGVERLEEQDILRQLRFDTGMIYDERLVAQSRRRLSGLELLEVAIVTPRLDIVDGTSVPMAVTVSEGKPRLLRLGIGYGSDERARGTLEWQHLNFFGGAKQATVQAKWSLIERGVEAGLTDPYVWYRGLSSRIGARAWRSRQLTYDSQTYGGSFGLAYTAERAADSRRTPVQYRARLTYVYDWLRFGITPEFLADQSRRDERIALGLNPETGRASGGLATVQVDLERHAIDSFSNPRRGASTTAHIEFASPGLGGTYSYAELGGDVRAFVPVGPVTFGGKAQASTIAARDPMRVPFAKRYFLGGSSLLRGWSRFEVSPLDDMGRPVGGRSVLFLSGEIRLPLPKPRALGVVGFVDAGNVWSGGWEFRPNDLRWAAGLGLSYLTPVGPVEMDVAWQLTPIRNLFINGEPSVRRWRIHFSLGHSF